MADVAIISEGTALIGAGAWFADRLFGPSVDALGNQLKVFLAERVQKIFDAGAAIAQQTNVEPEAIPPGLLARMLMDASFSEDTEEITDWWANLFVDASIAASNKHAVFSDMMALIGPVEARCLRDFFETFSFGRRESFFGEAKNLNSSVDSLLETAAPIWLGELPATTESLVQLQSNMLTGEVPWPLRPVTWSFPLKDQGGTSRSTMSNPWYSQNVLSVGILERAGVLRMVKATVPGYGFTSWINAVALTPVGLEFYRTCTGSTFA